MKKNEIVIQKVLPGSIGEEAGIEKGDRLVSINGEKIADIFDYKYFSSAEELLMEIMKPDGDIWEIEIEKEEYEDIGLEFEEAMLYSKHCTNKCIFCFIDQLPMNMRETLYFKDDDSRLSFLMGNYITMTNMKDEEIDRIIKYRMSPINISVHTTNPVLRKYMLGNRFAGKILDKIKKLTDNGISVNCQIVLCRGINDNEELDRTVFDLVSLYPFLNSISVVPVGITKHREGLTILEPYDRASSRKVIEQVEAWQEKLLALHNTRVVYAADEFYIMSDSEIPDYNAYEDFPQLENGVGLVAMLKYEFRQYLDSLDEMNPEDTQEARCVSIATGVSAYPFIQDLAQALEKRYNKLEVKVYQIINEFFGGHVTVTGLLTGTDLINQLSGCELGSELLLCRSMFKADEEIFLDDITLKTLEEVLQVKVTIVDNDGRDFIEKVTGRVINWQNL